MKKLGIERDTWQVPTYVNKNQGMALDEKNLWVGIMEGGKYVIGK